MELTTNQWLITLLCALIIGISKTGLPGIGILIVPLMAMVLPAKQSVGLVLPTLIIADVFAAAYYRRHADWHHLVKLLPFAVLGVIAGYFIMKKIDGSSLKPIIGIIVIAMLLIQTIYDRLRKQKEPLETQSQNSHINILLAMTFGILAGATSVMANAAGPIMLLYLLAMKLPKNEFIGTSAWYFFIMNWVKVPFIANLGLITAESLKINLICAPVIAIGAIAGIFVLKKMPQKYFQIFARVMTALSSLKLILG